MKISSSLQALGLAAITSLLPLGTGHAADLYFDQNGAAVGFGIVGGSTYDWGNGSPSVWNNLNTGGAGTFSSWNNASGDTAGFQGSGAASWGVNVTNDLTVGGITLYGGAVAANGAITISAAAPRTITLNPGAQITLNQGDSRSLIIGNNVDLSGSFALTGLSTSRFAIEGTGSSYNGTITASGGYITTYGNSRFGSGTKLVLNTGASLGSGSAWTGTMTFGELSGNGGNLSRTTGGSAGYTIKIDQATTTSSGVQMGSSSSVGDFKFAKSNVGTLVLDGSLAHNIAQSIEVTGGSLFVKSNLATTSNAANGVIVGGSGEFGGTTTTSKHVTLQAATSQLTPGMYNVIDAKQEVGNLTLANGLTASNGGTFNFTMNADDGLGGTLNSQILLTGGTLTLGGTKTANFLDYGTGDIQVNTAYTIFTASGITTSGWVVGDLPTGWEFDSFSVSGDNLQVTFGAVPEPTTTLLMGAACGFLLLFRRRHSLR